MEVVVGRIGRPQGVRGEVTVEVRTDEPELRLGPGAVLATDPASAGPLTIETGRVHSGRLLLRFAGVHDRTGAEALRNTLLIADVDPDQLGCPVHASISGRVKSVSSTHIEITTRK